MIIVIFLSLNHDLQGEKVARDSLFLEQSASSKEGIKMAGMNATVLVHKVLREPT